MKYAHQPRDEKPNMMPMIDVAFLVLIFFMALPLKRLDHKLQTELPKGHGWQPFADDPPLAVRIAIRKTGERIH
ncbi:MAG: biopolymer transporter ExbD, partial [Planctomycetota bacterium]